MEYERCIIITNFLHGKIRDLIDIYETDYIICADAGYRLAVAEGIQPSVVVGDFDSSSEFRQKDIPEDIPTVVWPHHKDYTDTGLCLDYAMDKGFRSILIIGGFGGREDHTIANIQNMFYFAREGAQVMMIDEQNIAFPLIEDEVTMPDRPGWYLSVFAHTDTAKGVTIRGAEYELEDGELDNFFPLGVCNWCIGNELTIGVREGALLVMLSRDLKSDAVAPTDPDN